MSRKHARPPDDDLLTVSKAIALERTRLEADLDGEVGDDAELDNLPAKLPFGANG